MPSSIRLIILGGFFMSERWMKVQKDIGYFFKNEDLLQQAFIRSSYSYENGGADNEVLELIGDRALDLVVTKYLIDTYGYMSEECDDYNRNEEYNEFFCDCDEGKLTDYKKKLVQKKTLAKKIDRLGWIDFLILGKSDNYNNVRNSDSVKEDLFEAVVGAVTIDSGWKLEQIESVVEIMLEPERELNNEDSTDYISKVYDWYNSKYGEQIEIEYSSYNGLYNIFCKSNSSSYYPRSGDRVATIYLKRLGRYYTAYESSNARAKREVCRLIYEDNENDMFSIKDEIEDPSKEKAINQLEILARRGYFSIPTYSFKEEYDNNGNPIWKVTCKVKEIDRYYQAKASSKKEAKKTAAFKMLKYIINNEILG